MARTDDSLFEPQPHTTLLTMLGAYLESRTDPVWSGGLVTALGYFGITESAARVALTRLVQRGLTERHRQGRTVFYTLTPRTIHLLEDGDDRIFSLDQRADPAVTWTVVWHALPESRKIERSMFVRQLRFHGFGQLQGGTWVSPRDYVEEVNDLVDTLGIGDAVAILRAEPSGDVSLGPLLGHLWKLDEVAQRYRRFAAGYRKLTRPTERTDREAFVACTELVQAFRSFASIDPELPEHWATHAPARRQATEVFLEAYALLREPAAAHFRTLTHPNG